MDCDSERGRKRVPTFDELLSKTLCRTWAMTVRDDIA